MKAPETRARVPKGYDSQQKMAIVMMVLDQERGQTILNGLDDEELKRLARATANLGRVDVSDVERAIADFTGEVGRAGNVLGTTETAEKMLRRMLPDSKVDEIMEEIRGPEGRTIWEKMSNISPEVLANYLKGEYPQTAAVILGKLPAQAAARILRLLPEASAADIAIRVVRMDSIQRDTFRDIEETLKREFMTSNARNYERDNAVVMAEMLNRSDPEMVEKIMRILDDKEPQAATRIRRIMFTFEDLIRVDRTTFPVLVSECPTDKLAVALSASTPEMREMFFASMSERAGTMLRDEVEAMPAQRKKAIEEAQAEIVAVAKRLEREGRIIILEDDENAEDN